ncbi:OmpL47-type beta-barrel domain-containing protein [Neobacillus sp. Marseille-QA0830]
MARRSYKKMYPITSILFLLLGMIFSSPGLAFGAANSGTNSSDGVIPISNNDTYQGVVSQAGNYTMKQLGESIKSDDANARVVTTQPGNTKGTVYYIAPDGNDNNNGTSPQTPWKSIQKVNATAFSPGDMILFKAGSSWELTEALHPKGSGEAGTPIVIGAYGSGAKPKFSAKNIGVPWTFTDGSTRYASDAIYLENQAHIEIRDLDISNKPDGYTGQESSTQAAMRADRRGIHIVGGNNTTQTELKDFYLHDLYVHDVAGEANGVSGSGWDPSKRTAGILFEIIVKGQNGLPVIANPVNVTGFQPTWFSDVTIKNNVLIDNSFGGIIVKQLQAWGERQDASAPAYDHTGWYPNTNFTIEDNYLDHDGSEYAADTIYLTCTENSVIRHNVSHGAGTSAIELYFTDSITVEWNEVYGARQKPTGADSNAIDPDKASTNALIQYNYLHGNGDGILLCGFIYGSAVVRYNVIQDSDSSKRYLNIHGDKGHNYVYNNIFYNSSSKAATFVSTSGDKNRYLNDSNYFNYLSNNIFYSPNNTLSRTDDGTSVIYSHNDYYNVSVVPDEDTDAIVADPKFKGLSAVNGGAGSDVNLSGFELQADSPLISVGKAITSHDNTTIPVGTITDIAGNPISPGGADLGIYEFQGTNSSIGDLRGYTFDPYGDIKAGVTVTAQAGGQTYTVTSDSRGFYSISGIPAGAEVTVTASSANYASSGLASVQVFGADVTALNLTLGASTLTTGAISGNVMNTAGAAVAVTDSTGKVVGKAVTANDGTYTIDNLPVGSGYTVTVQKQDFYDGIQNNVTVQAAHTTVVNITMSRVVKALHYFLKENFDYDAGAFSGNDLWNVNSTGGTVEIVQDETGNKFLKLAKTANADGVKVWNKTAMKASGLFTIESRIKRTAAGSSANQFAIYSGESIDSSGTINAPMADFGFSGGKIFTHATRGSSGTTTFSNNMNQWYNIKMVVNMDTDTFDFYIDGVLKKSGAQLRTAGNAINYFQIFASANNLGDFLVDYLWVYEGSPEGDDSDVTSVTVDELGGSALSYNTGNRTFTSASEVPYQYDSVKIHVTPSSPFAEVSLNGTKLGRIDDNDYIVVPLSAGENEVPLTITAADGTVQTYTIDLYKQDRSILAYLTALELSGLTLNPEFEAVEPVESDVSYSAGTTSEAEHTLTYATATSGSTVSIALNGQSLSNASPVNLTLKEGPNTITMVVSSESGDQFQTYNITVNLLDHTAPVTKSNAPTDWSKDDVTVKLDASDNQSGVAETFYSVDGSEYVNGTSFTISSEGEYTISFYSVDKTGNIEKAQNQHVLIDKTAPLSTAAVTPAQPEGLNGWFVSDVQLSLNVSDTLSGVDKTEYSLDGGNTWQTYNGPVTVNQDGVYDVCYRSSDNAGNLEETKRMAIHLDRTAPIIDVTGVLDEIYSDSLDINPAIELKDNLSGIDSTKTTVTLDGSNIEIGKAIPLYTLPLGQHEYSVTTYDLAGNMVNQVVKFQTSTSIQSLQELITRFTEAGWIDHNGIANSLESKLDAGNLAAFKNEVQAQSGKHISEQYANYLIRDADYLFSNK